MRKIFSLTVEKEAIKNKKIIFLTGDLGFMAFENLQESLGNRFVNVGVAEQNMISVAAGLASQGFIVFCYSIVPFAVFRPAEQIRNDVCLHNMNVKIVGNGGGYAYGVMGATHHAIEDIEVVSSFQKMRCYVPCCRNDIPVVVQKMVRIKGPAYLRLGRDNNFNKLFLPKYEAVRRLTTGDKVTIVSIGPVAINAFLALNMIGKNQLADFFVVSEIPLDNINLLKDSVKRTRKVIIVEEHVTRGGLGEYLILQLAKSGINAAVRHCCANGYPNGLYGSEVYHREINGLSVDGIANEIRRFTSA